MNTKRLVAGIKPTGVIHIGNYFGAMRPMLELQDAHECYLFVADLHALNQVQNAEELRRTIREIAIAYLAVGIDPEKVTLFQQSTIPEVGELSTILGACTSLGLLERAHAYKDAIAKGQPVNGGLFTYPVLMAADILLYRGEVVPVGQDQAQHLEMTREIAARFNHLYGETLPLPQPVHGTSESVLGLDGRKMSKSYGNVIGLFEELPSVRRKIMRIVTDSKRPEEPKDPDTCTIMSLYRLVAGPDDVKALEGRYLQGGIGYREAKEILADAMEAFLLPIQDKKREVEGRKQYVEDVLREGSKRARTEAMAVLDLVRERAGLTI